MLEHRYRYYMLADPVLTDWEYDVLERRYEAECTKAGVESILIKYGVDFQSDHPNYGLAKWRVDYGQDYHSLWLKEMQPVWDRLGLPKVYVDK
jgi:hypothetical protein